MGRVWLGIAQDGEPDDPRGSGDATAVVVARPLTRRPTQQHHERDARPDLPRLRWPRWLGGA